MNGAQSLVATLIRSGIDTCFANPGTSEMHFVAALDQTPGIRCVLGLHENVVTGMADGYWRIVGKPASTLLHCGPGLANGLANLHNARRARSGIVNIVGDQASWHRPFDPPLTADADALAGSVSAWLRTSACASEVGRDAAAAVQAARTHPGQIATLILPSDASWDEGGVVADCLAVPSPPPLDPHALDRVVAALRERRPTLLLLAGSAVSTPLGQQLAWRVAQATGASLLAQFGGAAMARGHGCVALERVGLDVPPGTLARFDHVVLVGANAPVSFFAQPGKPSRQTRSDARLHVLSRPEQDAIAALSALVEALQAPQMPLPERSARPDVAGGAPTPAGLAQTLTALLPEGAIVSDESVTFGHGLFKTTHGAARHDWLHLTGGAIGDGMPVATGAALAGGGRRVINLQADGSGMYTLQALWTQARERLPVTTIVFSNRKYQILLGEYKRVGAVPGPTAMRMLDLGDPDLQWVKLAEGMGVEAARAETMEQCADLLQRSLQTSEPFLIELMV